MINRSNKGTDKKGSVEIMRKKMMKIAVNMITTTRFIYTLFLPLLKVTISDKVFLINIIILFLTDWIDGFLARKFKVQTLYGSMMDTIADKALTIILIILLVNSINILSIILIGEIIISIINIIGTLQGKNVGSSIQGKIKMWLLSITILLGYMNRFNIINRNIVYLSGIITFIMQIVVNIGYAQNLKNQERIKIKNKYQIKNIKDLKYVLFSTQYYLNTI